MFIDTFDIQTTTAPQTYSKLGGMVELPAGSKTTRLIFKSSSNGSTQAVANVYVEVIGKGFFEWSKSFILSIMRFKFLKTTHQGKTIYININSLSNRLGVNIDKICSKNFDSELKEQFNIVCEKEKKIDAFFQRIKTKYTKEDNDKLITANGYFITKAYFRKILGLTAFSNFCSTQKQTAVYVLKNGHLLVLKKEKNKEWPLLTLYIEAVWDECSPCKKSTVIECSKGNGAVAKIAYAPEGYNKVKNEKGILNKIYLSSTPVGIQQKPYSSLACTIGHTQYLGYVMPKYDFSLNQTTIQELNSDEKIESARQLLKGLQALEEKQIAHRFIKEENCLLRRKSNTPIECVIANFEYAVDLSKETEVFLPFYLYRMRDKTSIEYKQQYANYKKQLLREDVYYMGSVLYSLLECIKNEKLHSLIMQMIENPWEKRISASEALAKFEGIFPPLSKNRNLKSRIPIAKRSDISTSEALAGLERNFSLLKNRNLKSRIPIAKRSDISTSEALAGLERNFSLLKNRNLKSRIPIAKRSDISAQRL